MRNFSRRDKAFRAFLEELGSKRRGFLQSYNRGNQRKLASLQEFKKRGMEVRWATVVGRNVGVNVWTSMVCPKLVSRALSLRAEVFRERIFLLATKPGFHFKADFFWRNFALFL